MTDGDEPGAAGGGSTDGQVSRAFLGRLAERTRLRRWSRTKVVLVVLGVLTVVAAIGWVFLFSSLFSVRSVQVRGVSGSLAAQVSAQADDQLGKPLARVDLDAVRESVEKVPGAADVVVQRAWPHTLRVAVVARKPIATTRAADGWAVLDREGVVLRTDASRPESLPTIVVGTGAGARLEDGVAVLAAVPPKLVPRVQSVQVRSGQDVRLDLDHGDSVHWGSAEDGARKAAVLTALLKQKATVYDVSAPDLPTTRK